VEPLRGAATKTAILNGIQEEYRRAMLEEALLEGVERELATRTDWTLPEP
jgi:hypothetical protein